MSDLVEAHLLVAVDLVNGLQELRIATGNRIGAIQREKAGSTVQLEGMFDAMEKLERQAIKEVVGVMKQHRLWEWIDSTPGIGAPTVGKLLAAIGDPSERKTVSQLWAYCGLHVTDGVAPRRKKGVQSNWNDKARTILFLMAAGMVKNKKSYYRPAYDSARKKYMEATHNTECQMCGTKGKPAQIGTPLSLAHQHKRALRIVMKEILKDIWKNSRERIDVAA